MFVTVALGLAAFAFYALTPRDGSSSYAPPLPSPGPSPSPAPYPTPKPAPKPGSRIAHTTGEGKIYIAPIDSAQVIGALPAGVPVMYIPTSTRGWVSVTGEGPGGVPFAGFMQINDLSF